MMAHWILRRSRLFRVLLAGALALCVVMACFPLVDSAYVGLMFDSSTVLLPSLVTAGIGLGVYMWGWYSLVGLSGEPPVPTRAMWALLLLGLLTLIINLALIVQGLSMTNWIAG